MITNFLLRLVARDADALIGFIEKVRDKLSALIIASADEIGQIEGFIEETIEDGKKAIADIEATVEREVLEGKTRIAQVGANIERLKKAAGLFGDA